MGTRRFHFGDLFKQKVYGGVTASLFDPSVFQRDLDESWLHPDFVKAVKEDRFEAPFLQKHMDGVYSFPCFTPKFCELLLQEIEEVRRLSDPDHPDGVDHNHPKSLQGHIDRPNGMNRYGVVLNQIGLQPLISYLQGKYVWPLAKKLYPVEAENFDDHHSFCVRYAKSDQDDIDVGLDMHEDDADVTLNVCLGKHFTGATLTFCHNVSDEKHRNHGCTYAHEAGRAIIHLGRHRHGADDIASGERINFLLWSLNAKYRTSGQFQADRLRSNNPGVPDKVCLSYTHDADYTQYLDPPLNADAEKRGVMLDQVERRRQEKAAEKQRYGVKNLASPGPEINCKPVLCLFLDEVREPEGKRRGATELVEFAAEFGEEIDCYCAVTSGGATAQVRHLCGGLQTMENQQKNSSIVGMLKIDSAERLNEDLRGSTSYSVGGVAIILDIPNSRYFRMMNPPSEKSTSSSSRPTGNTEITAKNLESFYLDWREDKLEPFGMRRESHSSDDPDLHHGHTAPDGPPSPGTQRHLDAVKKQQRQEERRAQGLPSAESLTGMSGSPTPHAGLAGLQSGSYASLAESSRKGSIKSAHEELD